MSAGHKKDPKRVFDLAPARRYTLARWRVGVGIGLVLFSAFFVLWLIAGTVSMVQSPLDVFGADGFRILAGLNIAGLLAASVILADL